MMHGHTYIKHVSLFAILACRCSLLARSSLYDMIAGLEERVVAAGTTWHDFLPVYSSLVVTSPAETSTRRTGKETKFIYNEICGTKTILK